MVLSKLLTAKYLSSFNNAIEVIYPGLVPLFKHNFFVPSSISKPYIYFAISSEMKI
jgi:hypothetical protein